MESVIDQRYRLDLIKYHLDGFENKKGKLVFYCPLCQFSRPQGKYVQKKGGMFWCAQLNAWRFNCMKCLPMTSMYRFLEKVNPEMARRYQIERWHSGTTGWGHDCPRPQGAELLIKIKEGTLGVSTAGYFMGMLMPRSV